MNTIKVVGGIAGAAIAACLSIGLAAAVPQPPATEPDAIALDAADSLIPESGQERAGDGAAPGGSEAEASPPAAGGASCEDATKFPSEHRPTTAPDGIEASSAQTSTVHGCAAPARDGGDPPSEALAPQPAAAHACSWTPVTEQVWVVDKAAWDEPRYTTVEHTVCSVCFTDLTEAKVDVIAHGKAHVLAGEGGGTHSEGVKVQTGTVHHEASGHYEQKAAGYVCEGCGAHR